MCEGDGKGKGKGRAKGKSEGQEAVPSGEMALRQDAVLDVIF